MISEFI